MMNRSGWKQNELGSLYTWRKSPADILNRECGGNEAVLTSGNWTARNWSSLVILLQKFNIHGWIVWIFICEHLVKN